MLELYNEAVQDLLAPPEHTGSGGSGASSAAAAATAAAAAEPAEGDGSCDADSDASDDDTVASTLTSSTATSNSKTPAANRSCAESAPAASAAHATGGCDSSCASGSQQPSDPVADVSFSSGSASAPAASDVVASAGVHRSAAVAAALQQTTAGAAPPVAHVARAVTGHGAAPVAVPEERVLSFADAKALLQQHEAASAGSSSSAVTPRLGRAGSVDRPSRQGGTSSGGGTSIGDGGDGAGGKAAGGGPGLRLVDLPDHGTVALGATQVAVTQCDQVAWLLARADAASSYACTRMNEASNRAHRLFTFTVHFQRGGAWYTSTLTLADLAGCEDVSRSGAAGAAAREASHINKSLLTLGRVINALASSSAHIPYRESKLTRLLADALGGVCKTTFVACVGPAAASLSETLSTLRYARRASEAFNISQLPRWQQDDVLIETLARRVQTLEADTRAAAAKHARDAATLQTQLAAAAQQRDEAAAALQAATARADGLRVELAVVATARDAYLSQRAQLQATLCGVRRTRDVLLAAHRRQEAALQAREAELRARVAGAHDDIRRLRAAVDAKADAARANQAAALQFGGGVREQLTATGLRVTAFCDAQSGGHAALAAGLAGVAADVDAGQQALRAGLAAVTAGCHEGLDALRQRLDDALSAATTQAAAGAGSAASALAICTSAVDDLQRQVVARTAAAAGAAADTEARVSSRLSELQRRVGQWGADLGVFSAGLADGLTALQAQLDRDAAALTAAIATCGDAAAAVAAAQQAALASAGDRLLSDMHAALERLVRQHVDAAAARSTADGVTLAAAHTAAAAGVRDAAALAGTSLAALQTAVQDRTITDAVEAGASKEYLAATSAELAAATSATARAVDDVKDGAAAACGDLARCVRDAQAAAATSASALVQSLGAASQAVADGTRETGASVAAGVAGVGVAAAASALAASGAVVHLQSTQQALQVDCAEHGDDAHAAVARLRDGSARFLEEQLSFDVTPAPADELPPPPPALPPLGAYDAVMDEATEGGDALGTAAEALRSAWAHEERVAAGDAAARDCDDDAPLAAAAPVLSLKDVCASIYYIIII
jgi:hypothetical protein